ncbi:MFS transporter [Umezawaea beigongshangensis]|uniref:MFS transporter n=1 Tax=Umezawaea beigongshangensis TaxID=2780383 RepID=UPI0018F26413|nr:MFS transporter [Umezawaea beigongshangensis]
MAVSGTGRLDGDVLTRESAGAPPSRDGGAARAGLLLGVLYGLAGSGASAAAVALPALGVDLDVAGTTTAWVLSGYVLTLAVTTAVHGRLADVVGVRAPVVAGVVIMAVGSAVSALASSFPLLLAGRVVQGVGAAAIPVLATALLSARYEGAARAGALGRLAGVAGAFGALGPFLGGALALAGTWRLTMALPVLGLLFLPLLWRLAPRTGSGGTFDGLGAVLVASTAAGLVLLVQSPSAGPVVAVVGAVLLLLGVPLVLRHVRRRPDGFLPRPVATSRVLITSAVAAAAVPLTWFGTLVAVPAVLAQRGWSPLAIGALLVPSAVVGLLAARVVGRVLTRLGAPRTLATAAALSAVSSLVAALGVVVPNHVVAAVLLGAGVCVVAVAFAFGQPAMIAAAGNAVAPEQRGAALGVATLVFLVGGGTGSAVMGGLQGLLGLGGCLLLIAAPSVVAALVVLRLPRS